MLHWLTPPSEPFPDPYSQSPHHPRGPPIPERLPTFRVVPSPYTLCLHLCMLFSAPSFGLFSYLRRLTLGRCDSLVEFLQFLVVAFLNPDHQ